MCVLDEVQKAPSLIETIKAAHDRDEHSRYVLLGSSQILLLSKVKESLAGRVSILELWPLTLPEMVTPQWDMPLTRSPLVSFLEGGGRDSGVFRGIPGASPQYAMNVLAFERYLLFGGMPVVHDPEISDAERRDWLTDYQTTYLQRDVADLANLRDLEPFILAQNAIAARTATTVNFSDLARQASVSSGTAQRFMRYLELSYQVLILRPWFRNPHKRLVRMPKVHFLDPGVQRSILRRRGEPGGEDFESAVVSEIHKQVRNAALPIDLFHLRTHDGREVDLLLELENGYVAIEVKAHRRASSTDARHLRGLGEFLDKPLLFSLVLSRDNEIQPLDESILALPVAWALGATGPDSH